MNKENAIAIIERFQNCINHDSCEKVGCEYFNTLNDLKNLVEWLKNNSDNNVHCKDCRYYKPLEGKVTCLLWKADIYPDFYCKNGEVFDGKDWGEASD